MPIGSKSLSLDPVWSAPPVDEIEEQLLRLAAFPEIGAHGQALQAEFVILDPALTSERPAGDDLSSRMARLAQRLNLSLAVIGHHSADRDGAGGFPHSIDELDAMDDGAFASAFATLRDRIGWVLSSSRFSRQRHIVVPAFDAAMLAATVELLTQLPDGARPFVHLITQWDAPFLPNARRFGDLSAVGRAVHQLNAERTSIFFYAWSRPLALRLSERLGLPVRPLDPPPEFALASEGEAQSERLTLGYFGAPTRARGFDLLPQIVRSANQSASQPRRIRFVVQASEGMGRTGAEATAAELAALPERNVSLIEERLAPNLFYAAVRQVDGVILPYAKSDAPERFSHTASHAMAAGKLVLTLDSVRMPGLLKSRVVSARGPKELGETIADLAGDLALIRRNASVAKATYWSTLRPSRLFAELLYGPVVLGAKGAT